MVRLLFAAVAAVAALAWGVYRWETHPPPVVRGHRLALTLGCAACHDLGGGPGAPNPGSREGHVPGWGGGNAMMYFPKAGDLAAWIGEGAPERYRGSRTFREQQRRQALTMPAYGARLSRGELADLVAFVAAVAEVNAPAKGDAAEGYAVAARSGCFRCHGPGGLGGVDNPGSFAGYIPGWRGRGYRALVRDRGELIEWIRDGHPRRIEEGFLIRTLLERQQLHMPAYGDHLTGAEIDALAAYIAWLNDGTAVSSRQ